MFLIASQWFHIHSDAEVTLVLNGLAALHIPIAIAAGPLTAGSCGRGVEGFNAGDAVSAAQIVQQHGGSIDYVAMDEPLLFGQFYDGSNACHWTT